MISQNQTLGFIAMLEDLNSEITKLKKTNKQTRHPPPQKKPKKQTWYAIE